MIDFVNDSIKIADKAQLHPNIFLQLNRVILNLISYDAGGIADLGIKLSQQVDHLDSYGPLCLQNYCICILLAMCSSLTCKIPQHV